MNATTYSVDLASRVFQVHGYDAQGQCVNRRRLSRPRFDRWCDEVPAGTQVVMEATGSAHHWGRRLQARAVRVKLLPPQHVEAMRIGNKTDANDTDAIYDASRRAKVQAVPVKTAEQQARLAEHRRRQALIRERTRAINQMRGLLREFGILLDRRQGGFRRQLPRVLEDADNGLPIRARTLLAEAWEDLVRLDARVAALDARFRQQAATDPTCGRLLAVEGIGALAATALVASVGEGPSRYRRARQFAASLGLVPREHSSGQRQQLGRITKRGNRYLRYLLVQGARAVVQAAAGKNDPRSRWIHALQARMPYNRVVVAVANKNARIVWALLSRGETYRRPTA
jgi:transposase